MKINDTLNERGQSHGDFTDNAFMAQEFKRVLVKGRNYEQLDDVKKEALHMICHKMARILSGDPNHDDHWQDIAGYATLTVQRLKK